MWKTRFDSDSQGMIPNGFLKKTLMAREIPPPSKQMPF